MNEPSAFILPPSESRDIQGEAVKVVIGIGNPGREYADTRHNVGFRVVEKVVDLLARQSAGGLPRGTAGGNEWARKRKFKCLMADRTLGERVLLVKPETYVNLSGECARAVLDYYGVGVDSLLVVSDDVNLAVGRLRCRREGSSGGHNGMDSVIRHLGTDEFARLRVGVGMPVLRQAQDERPESIEGPLVRHVLGRFASEDRPAACRAESRAAEAVLEWVRNDVESCMNAYNSS